VLLRIKDDHDGAEPSANSISVLNLLRLAQFTDNKNYLQRAEKTLSAFSVRLERIPSAMPQMLSAVDELLHKPVQVIIAGRKEDAGTREMLCALHGRFLPGKAIVLADGGAGQSYLAGKATAYICRDYTCRLPTTDVKVMLEQLHLPSN
jgi:uncharacterized protein YyaL (SSP411 family)